MNEPDSSNVLVPLLPADLLALISLDSDPFLCSINENIESLNKLGRLFPERYNWRFKTVEALKAELGELLSSGAQPADINCLYWIDVLATCEAYTVMSLWRMVELIRAAVWAAARRDFVCAALVARAALESAIQYVNAARTITATIDPIFGTDLTKNIAASEALEDYLLKTVYASRLPDTEKYYSPTNILTLLNRTAKITGMSNIALHYGALCEVAHPNFLGRSVYLLEAKPGPRTGDEIRVIGRGAVLNVNEILKPTVWALSWAAGTQVTATVLMQTTVKKVMNILPKTPSARAS